MNEQKIIKKQLFENMFLNLIAFSIIFTIFGIVIFNMLKTSIYKSSDDELLKTRIHLRNSSIVEKMEPENNNGKNITRKVNSINPRITVIRRNELGEIINQNTIGRFYDEYISYIEFEKNNLDSIYEISINEYTYRAINIKNINEANQLEYIQLLINVDAEKAIMQNYFRILVIAISITIILSIIASYILSKKSLMPIIQSWKKQTEFVQNASHELRTPLTIIQAKQELLLQEPESKIIDKSEDIMLTLNESKRLAKMTKDLMLLANADSNKQQINKEEINLDKLIEEIVLPYKDFASIQDKNINMDLKYNRTIKIDRNRIHQLMIILLDNAIKYTEANDNIYINTYQKDGKCVIEVKDTGIGISEEAMQHIFDRFYREDKARSRQTGGAGLRIIYCRLDCF